MNETVKNALILFTITLVASVLLALASQVTAEPIKVQKAKQTATANAAVLPDTEFEELADLDLSSYEKITAVYAAKKGNEVVGYTFKLITNEGYSAGLELIVGLSTEGAITGIDIIKHSETPGLGAKADEDPFKGQFTGKPLSELTVVKGAAASDTEISAISGATITSRAVTNAVNEAVACYNELLKEGN